MGGTTQKMVLIWMGPPTESGWDLDRAALKHVKCGEGVKGSQGLGQIMLVWILWDVHCLSVRTYLPYTRSFICWAYSNFCQYKVGLSKTECLCSLALYLSLIVSGRTNLFLWNIFIFLSFNFTTLYSCHFIYNFVHTKGLSCYVLHSSGMPWVHSSSLCFHLSPLLQAIESFFLLGSHSLPFLTLAQCCMFKPLYES